MYTPFMLEILRPHYIAICLSIDCRPECSMGRAQNGCSRRHSQGYDSHVLDLHCRPVVLNCEAKEQTGSSNCIDCKHRLSGMRTNIGQA